MAKETSNKVPTIEVPLVRNKNGIDEKATLAEAQKLVSSFAKTDQEATKAVVATTSKILADEKHKDVTVFTAGVLAKMALGLMGEIPTDKLCAETEERVKAFMTSQPEKYLHITAGRNSGFHIIDRYTKEDLATLQKVKKTEEATAK